MNRRATTAAAVAAAIVLLAPSSAVAVVDNSIGLHAPKTAKPDKKFTLTAVATFDSRVHSPPYAYLKAGVWQHRGDDDCLKAVPVDRSGWKLLIHYDFYPAGDGSDDYPVEFTKTLKRKAGTYRWCGYVYTIEYDSFGNASYHAKARDQAKTSVRD